MSKKYTKHKNTFLSKSISLNLNILSNKDFTNLLSSFKYLSKSELALLLYIDYIQRYNFNDNNNLNIIDFCNLTGTCRASFYTAYKSLINKGIISKDLCNIVDTTYIERNKK